MANPDAASSGGNARELFVQKCGGCHTLEAAGTRGTIGPDLDAAFRTPRDEGFDEATIREVVLGQMRFPVEPMPEPDAPEMFPSNEWSDEDRDAALNAIATFVASVAGDEEATKQALEQQGGGEQSKDPKAIFTSNCAGCHTFEPAGSKGTIGPNLDQTSMDVEAIARQIREGGGGMPAFGDQLSDEQIKALADYVANQG